MNTPTAQPISLNPYALAALAGAAIAVIGSLLPWASVSFLGISESLSGTDTDDGKITLGVAIGAGVIALFLARGRVLPAVGLILAGGAVAGIAIYDITDFHRQLENYPIAAPFVDLESGIYMTAAGGAVAAIAGLAALFGPAMSSPAVAAPGAWRDAGRGVPAVQQRPLPASPAATVSAPPAFPRPEAPPALRRSHLVVQSGEMAGQSFPLTQNTTIGRSSQNDVAIPDALVSREHAVILEDNGRFVFMDQGARNRSYLVTPEGQREVTRHILTDGDQLLIGDTRFVFRQM